MSPEDRERLLHGMPRVDTFLDTMNIPVQSGNLDTANSDISSGNTDYDLGSDSDRDESRGALNPF